jgi:hypothetical protein
LGRSDRSRRAIGGCGGFFTLPLGSGWHRCPGTGPERRRTGDEGNRERRMRTRQSPGTQLRSSSTTRETRAGLCSAASG